MNSFHKIPIARSIKLHKQNLRWIHSCIENFSAETVKLSRHLYGNWYIKEYKMYPRDRHQIQKKAANCGRQGSIYKVYTRPVCENEETSRFALPHFTIMNISIYTIAGAPIDMSAPYPWCTICIKRINSLTHVSRIAILKQICWSYIVS